MSSEERERYRYENAMNESQTFSPQYDLVKPTDRSNRAYDLQKSLRLQKLLYGGGGNSPYNNNIMDLYNTYGGRKK